MVRAIYQNITSESRYVVGAVSFNAFNTSRMYNVWVNSTYDRCYQGSSTNVDFNLHRQEIEHAVANAINKYDIPGIYDILNVIVDKEPIDIKLRYNPTVSESLSMSVLMICFIDRLQTEANYHVFVILAMGVVYLIYVSMTLISEKKNKMIDYLRTLGLMESVNILAYITIYSLFSIIPSILYEISGRLLDLQLVSKTSYGVLLHLFFSLDSNSLVLLVHDWYDYSSHICVVRILHAIHSSTIVIRPSRIAITLGLLLLVMGICYSSYTGWMEDLSFPTYEEDGWFSQGFYLINPSYSAFRSLAIIYYFVQTKGEFTWSDFSEQVPSQSWRDVYMREG